MTIGSRFFLFGCLLALLAGSGPAAAQDLKSTVGELPQIEKGAAPDVRSLAADSSVIVRGRVIKGEPRWVGRVIYTFYDVAVEETIKGLPHKTVSVAVPGGALGKVQLIVPQAPKLANGEGLVFFGRKFKVDGSAYQPTGALAGLIPVAEHAGKAATVDAARQARRIGRFSEGSSLGERSTVEAGRGAERCDLFKATNNFLGWRCWASRRFLR